MGIFLKALRYRYLLLIATHLFAKILRNITKVAFNFDYFIFENELDRLSHICNLLVLYLYTILSKCKEKKLSGFCKITK